MNIVIAILLALANLIIGNAWGAEVPVPLKPGAGAELMEQNCSGCHSLDYVRMNAPFLTGDVWKAELTKMRTAFAAQVDDADAARILAYLTATYGPAK
jgi:mono/diheme cytochrome c family protein